MEVTSLIKVENEDINNEESTTQKKYNIEHINYDAVKSENESVQFCNVNVKIEQENVETQNNDVNEKCNTLNNDNLPKDMCTPSNNNIQQNDRYVCKFCKISFALKSFYDNHSKYCQTKYLSKFGKVIACNKSFEERRFSCLKCGYRTNDSGNLKRHILTHSGVKPYKCSFCNYSAIQKISLQRHINYKHNTEKLYQCDECSYKSANSRDVKRHKIVHAQDKPFVCHICQKSFNQNLYLEAHMYKHTGKEKPHRCDQCDYSTLHDGNLKKHVKIKHCKVKLHVCEICELKFALPETLKRHMYCHTNDKPYKCKQCPIQFITPGKLINHIKKKHSDEIIKEKIN